MLENYVWLLKGDNSYKLYKEKGWNTIISVITELDETYFCLAKQKQFVSEEEKTKLITPVYLNNEEYRDYIISFGPKSDFGFIWNQKRCFSVSTELINELVESKMNLVDTDLFRLIEAPADLVDKQNIKVKSSSLSSIIFMILSFILLACVGIYVWLF